MRNRTKVKDSVTQANPVDEEKSDSVKFDAMVINEVQLILAEKRTSLAVLRTGIAVLALPLSITGLLIATSRYYDTLHVLHLLIPLGAINLALLVFGAWLVFRSIIRMHHYDVMVRQIKRKHSLIGEFID